MKRFLVAAFAIGCVVAAAKLLAQAPAAAPTPASTGIGRAPSGAVPVPEPSEKALRYYRSGIAVWLSWTAVALFVPFVFAFSGAGARLRNGLARVTRDRWLPLVTLYGVAYTAIVSLLELPLSYFTGYVREHAYGLSNQTLGKWAGDSAKELVVSCVMAALVTWIPYLLLKKSPRRWWFYTGLAAFPLTALLLVVAPVWIDPLFNKFGPMKDKALEARILDLADRAGIEGSRVFEVAKSVDTTTVNAYVTGFLGTKRIVLWDTIVAKLEPDELLFVMGHEMGHYVLGHVAQSVVLVPLGVMLGLFVIDVVAKRLIARFKERLGFTELSDVASLPFVMFLFLLGSLVASPAVLAYSRHLEHEADRFGLELTRTNAAAARAFVVLQEENLSVPRPAPVLVFFRSSHPPLGERIDFCNSYRPWEEGAPMRYADRMKEEGDRR